MATTSKSVTAGKLKVFAWLIAFACVIVTLDMWSRSDWPGAPSVDTVLLVIMTFVCSALLVVFLAEILATGYFRERAVVRQVLMAIVAFAGVAAAAWLWVNEHELLYVVFISTVVCDTAAQLGGRKLSYWHDSLPPSHPSGPRDWLSIHPHQLRGVSAGKTIGGFVSGVVAAMLCVGTGLVICILWLDAPFAWWLVPVVPVTAIAGDLLASWVKRGMKSDDFYCFHDEHGLLGFHGGLLDRFDSHLCVQIVTVAVVMLG